VLIGQSASTSLKRRHAPPHHRHPTLETPSSSRHTPVPALPSNALNKTLTKTVTNT